MLIYAFISKNNTVIFEVNIQKGDLPEKVAQKILGWVEKTRNKKTFNFRNYFLTLFTASMITYGIFYDDNSKKELAFEFLDKL